MSFRVFSHRRDDQRGGRWKKTECRNFGEKKIESRTQSHRHLRASLEMSTQANDPRQPSAAKPFVSPAVNPQDLPVDYSGFIAVVFGIAGVMFRYKLSSWLAIIFCAQSLANMRNMENDLKQISMAMM
ncbi:Protein Asterix, partial [Cucurbita argyrosperma subsp. argyrosperma]